MGSLIGIDLNGSVSTGTKWGADRNVVTFSASSASSASFCVTFVRLTLIRWPRALLRLRCISDAIDADDAGDAGDAGDPVIRTDR